MRNKNIRSYDIALVFEVLLTICIVGVVILGEVNNVRQETQQYVSGLQNEYTKPCLYHFGQL